MRYILINNLLLKIIGILTFIITTKLKIAYSK